MTLHFTPGAGDYETTMRLFLLHDKRTQVGLALAALTMLVLVAVLWLGDKMGGVGPLVLLMILPSVVSYLLVVTPRRLGQHARRNPRFVAPVTWRLDDAGALVANRFAEVRLAWSDFGQVVETGGYFLLVHAADRRLFQFIPKRSFASPQEEASFRALLARHVRRAA